MIVRIYLDDAVLQCNNLTTEIFCIKFCAYRPTLHQKMLNPVFTCTSLTGETTWPWVISNITGPCWDPYWVVSVLSPILFILLIVKAILMIIKDELFRKFFVIHILAVIVSSYSVVCSVEFYAYNNIPVINYIIKLLDRL